MCYWLGWSSLKVSTKYRELLFATLTSVVMSFILTFIITIVNTGMSPEFWELWVRGFAVSSALGVPISLVVIPLVRQFVDKIAA
jgi:preprotein translocase subunit SecD